MEVLDIHEHFIILRVGLDCLKGEERRDEESTAISLCILISDCLSPY